MKTSILLLLTLLKGSSVAAESGLLRVPARGLHGMNEVDLLGFEEDVQARSLQESCDEKATAYRRCLSSLPDKQVARTCVDCIRKDLDDNGKRRSCPNWNFYVCELPLFCGCSTCSDIITEWAVCSLDACTFDCTTTDAEPNDTPEQPDAQPEETQPAETPTETGPCGNEITSVATCSSLCLQSCQASAEGASGSCGTVTATFATCVSICVESCQANA